jgi:hypothetical protein
VVSTEFRLRTGGDLRGFDAIAREALDGMLASYGFVMELSRVEGSWAMRRYRNGHRYITVEIRTHVGEQPVGRVRVGTGSSDWPEAEWNQIPLWKLVKAKKPDHSVTDYLVDNLTLRSVLTQIATDLQDFGMEFIGGELFTFKRLRAEAARLRPHYEAAGSGPYSENTLRSIRISKLLKEKYSSENAA